jgi:hypothetical protein
MSTFMFDTSGPLSFVQLTRKKKKPKKYDTYFHSTDKRQLLLYVAHEDKGKKILTSLVMGDVNLHYEDRLSATELSYWQF